MPITEHPLHGSGRAALPHPAPALGHEREALVRVRMTNMRHWKPRRNQSHHAPPRHERRLATTLQRGAPEASEGVMKRRQTRRMAGHPKVAGVPHPHRAQVGSLFGNGRVQPTPQLGFHRLQLRLPPLAHRLAQHRTPSLPRLAARMRETEKVEGLGFAVATPSPIPGRMPTEFDEARFVGMQRQTEPCEAFPQVGEEAHRFLTMLEADDEIIGEPDDDPVALRLLLPPSRDPEVKHVVKIEVGEERTDAAALNRLTRSRPSATVVRHWVRLT